MVNLKILFEKTRNVKTPIYSTEGAAGLDFFIPDDIEWESKTLYHGESALVPSGIKVQLPHYLCLVALNKSGLGAKGLNVGACLIDPDYRGEIHLNVFNTSHAGITIYRGEKLVQFIGIEHVRLELQPGVLSKTARQEKAFGSTGKF